MKSCSRCKLTTDAFYKDKRASDGLQSQCIPCVREGQKRSIDARRDEVLARRRELRAQEPTGRIEESRNYYLRNSNAIKARVAAYQAANAGKVAASRRGWRERNPQAAALRDRQAYERAAAAYKSRAAARRARLAREPGFNADDIAELKRKQRGKCAICRSKLLAYEIDHILPLARGGEHHKRNLQLTCRGCNRRKHSKHPIDFMQSLGYLL